MPGRWLQSGKFGEIGLAARSSLKAPSEDAIPNPNRASNPFHPKNGQDWTTTEAEYNWQLLNTNSIIEPNGSLPHYSDMERLPPFSPTHREAQILALEHIKATSAPFLPPPIHQGSGVTRKPAPPVPRKPSILTSSNSNYVKIGQVASSGPTESDTRIRRISVTHPSDIGSAIPVVEAPSSQLITSTALSSTGDAKYSRTSTAQASRLPAVPNRATSAQRFPPRGLLDGSDEDACLIPPIQPTRRQL